MKKLFLYLSLILAGFVGHKVVYEMANLRVYKAYHDCELSLDADPAMQQLYALLFCSDKLRYNKMEQILLFQPNFWCQYDDMKCEDRK